MKAEGATVRPARWPADRDALAQVREAVFVAEQGVPRELEWDGEDAVASHWLAEDADGNPIGVVRLLPTGQIGRMAVSHPWRGCGIGTRLLEAVLDGARARGFRAVWLNAQTSALSFYARHGLVAEGDEFEEAGIPHRRMRLTLDDTR
jgi:predicted GNAT family N-acyltransferase